MYATDPGADTALIVIDLQPDLMPGGPLGCHDGDAIVPRIAQLLRARQYATVVATQDWHPPGHLSFARSHVGHDPFEAVTVHGQSQMLWPEHCVQGTPGAALDQRVDWSPVDLLLRKGAQAQVDAYSAFRERRGVDGVYASTGLAGWLRERGIAEIHVCGLGRESCALWSAQDARKAGFRVRFLWELTRPMLPESDDATRQALAQAQVLIGPQGLPSVQMLSGGRC